MTNNGSIGKTAANAYAEDGKSLVSRIRATDNIKEDIRHAVAVIGGFGKTVEKGDTVLLKPNYNSADPPPASTDPAFLKAVAELLFESGAGKVVVGESSMQATSTKATMTKASTLEALKDSGVELAFFDENGWSKVHVDGEYLKTASLPEKALHVDKLVYSCCMKTHFRADFSLSLKLAFGFVKGNERLAFHLRHLKEKLVDLNLVVHPSLMIMDGRKCFITGGPFSGQVREPNVILASGDRVAMDVEAIKIIESFEGSDLKADPWSYPQIRHAVKLGLGAKSEKEYLVKTG